CQIEEKKEWNVGQHIVFGNPELWIEAQERDQRQDVSFAQIALEISANSDEGQNKKENLFQFHRNQVKSKTPINGCEQCWVNRRIESRSIDGEGWVVDIAGVGVGTPFDNVLRVMHIHCKVVAPDVPLPYRGGVKDADRNKKSEDIDLFAHEKPILRWSPLSVAHSE